jgi:hypothetical protein
MGWVGNRRQNNHRRYTKTIGSNSNHFVGGVISLNLSPLGIMFFEVLSKNVEF